MNGRTFLRLDQRGRSEAAPLLDYTLNYAAVTDETNGMLYAAKGLFGLYPGHYSVMPYYMKTQEYSNLESRDLWEYRLALSSAALDRLVRHSWELGNASFPYYFFNKNCSYQLLPLLEAAEPALRLTPEYPVWVIPADTSRLVYDQPGLVSQVRYRPSHLQKMRRDRARLTASERRLAAAAVERPVEVALSDLGRLPEDRQAAVLDAAEDYLLLRGGHSPGAPEAVRGREAALLAARSRLPTPAQEAIAPPTPPHDGHATARWDLGGGSAEGTAFGEFTARAALHDLLDPPGGYTPDSQLEMGMLRIRRTSGGRTHLRELKFVDLRSISVWDPWARKPSWEVRTGVYSGAETGRERENSLYYGLRGGSGIGVEASWGGRQTAYVFLEADAGAGAALKDAWRAGGGGTAGLSWQFSPRLRALAEGTALGYVAGDGRPTLELRAGADFSLTRALGLRLQWIRRAQREEALLSLLAYL